MFGLTVRWSLREAPASAVRELREYVTETSLERFTGMAGLSYKTWRMRPGEWFEGTYVWATAEEREAFAAAFAVQASSSPGSTIIGSAPVLTETFEVVGVAEGGEGFVPGPGPGFGATG
ncbi:MAG: hypothetical protein P8Z68_04950 [Kineosporiaceae bacterium]|jgi:hypothetical protein